MISRIGNRRQQNHGFTLIEIMITVSIVAIGIVLIIQGYSTALKVIKLSSEFTQAILFAEKKMWDFEGQESHFKEDKNFEYAVKIENTDEARINQLKLDIFWKNGRVLKNLEVITYLKNK